MGIGIIHSPSDLDAESQKIIHEEIDNRYFTPIIKAIHRVKERFGVHQWEVETSRGNAPFPKTDGHKTARISYKGFIKMSNRSLHHESL